MSNKPKEWDLVQGEGPIQILTLADGPPIAPCTRMRVIERTAFEGLETELTKMKMDLHKLEEVLTAYLEGGHNLGLVEQELEKLRKLLNLK